MYILESLLNID